MEQIPFAFAQETGYVSDLFQALPDNVQVGSIVNVMIAEAIQTSAIKEEYFIIK